MPVMPLVETTGNTGAGAPLHIGAIALNIGVVAVGLTVTVSDVVVAHCPAFGVNV